MRSASRSPVTGDDVLALLDGVSELWATRGRRVLRFGLPERAPALRAGSRLLVGYTDEALAAFFA